MIRIVLTAKCDGTLACQFIECRETEGGRRTEGSMTEAVQDALVLCAVETVSSSDDGVDRGAQPPSIGFRRNHRP